MNPTNYIHLTVHGGAHSTLDQLQRKALDQASCLLEVDSREDAAKLLSEVQFSVYTEGYVEVVEGDIVGRFPTYRGELDARIRDEKDSYYSGRLF